MYKKLKEKFRKLLKKESKLEHYEEFLVKLTVKKNFFLAKEDDESIESVKVINKLIEKLKEKIKKFK